MSDAVRKLVLVFHGEARSAVDPIIGGHKGCTEVPPLARRQVAALAPAVSTGALQAADHRGEMGVDA